MTSLKTLIENHDDDEITTVLFTSLSRVRILSYAECGIILIAILRLHPSKTVPSNCASKQIKHIVVILSSSGILHRLVFSELNVVRFMCRRVYT